MTPSTGGEIDVAAGATLTYAGVIANNTGGSDGLTVGSGTDTGTLVLSNTETYTGPTAVNAGTLQLTGHLSVQSTVTVAAGATIDGTGTYAGSVNVDGTIQAGTPSTTGILTTGNLTFGSGTLDVQLNGTTAGSGYDQVSANGVNLTGATLVATLGAGFNPTVGTSFKIISNTSNNPITSTFVGQPEGSVIMIGGLPFTISYVGGDGNDVVLTRVASTTTTLTSNPVGPITQGTSITFTATISGSPSVGAVSFYYNYGQSGQFQIGSAVNVSGGSATSAATTALPVGSDTITAIYSGGLGIAGSQGTLVIQVNSANQATTTSVTSNPVGPITQGTSVDFTASISGSPGVGTVSFYYNYGQSGQFQIGSAVNVERWLGHFGFDHGVARRLRHDHGRLQRRHGLRGEPGHAGHPGELGQPGHDHFCHVKPGRADHAGHFSRLHGKHQRQPRRRHGVLLLQLRPVRPIPDRQRGQRRALARPLRLRPRRCPPAPTRSRPSTAAARASRGARARWSSR